MPVRDAAGASDRPPPSTCGGPGSPRSPSSRRPGRPSWYGCWARRTAPRCTRMAVGPRRPAGGRRAGREVGLGRGHLRRRTCTTGPGSAPRSTRLADRCVQRLREAGPLGAHRGAQGAPLRLLHADPLRDAAGAHRRPGGGPGDRAAAARGGGHHGRGAAAGGRGLGAGRLHAGGPVRAGRRGRRGARRSGGGPARRRRRRPSRRRRSRTAAPLEARAGRHARRARAGLGAGQRGRDGSRCASRCPARPPGRVRTFRVDDPALEPARPAAAAGAVAGAAGGLQARGARGPLRSAGPPSATPAEAAGVRRARFRPSGGGTSRP